MDVKNLLGKLHAHEEVAQGVQKPIPPTPRTPAIPSAPVIEDRQRPASGGNTVSEDFEGIILDLGEGISLNIPVQRRMSLSDFIKLAEKVKALEMLSESPEGLRHRQL